MSYLSDRQVASILRIGEYPQTDFIEWEDEQKDEFLHSAFLNMTQADIAEIWGEVACDMRPNTAGLLFTDPLAFSIQFSHDVYMYLEPQLRDQITSARDLIEKEAA